MTQIHTYTYKWSHTDWTTHSTINQPWGFQWLFYGHLQSSSLCFFLTGCGATAVLKKLKPAVLFPSFYNFLYQKIGNTVIGESVVIKGQSLQQIKVVGYNTNQGYMCNILLSKRQFCTLKLMSTRKGSSQHKYAVKTRTVVLNMALTGSLSVSSGILRYHLLITFFSFSSKSQCKSYWLGIKPTQQDVCLEFMDLLCQQSSILEKWTLLNDMS